jgi:biopolymer transport protein ExbD
MRHQLFTHSANEYELDLKPFINFLVVLIPVLMLSAEFAQISVINLKLPESSIGANPNALQNKQPLTKDSNLLRLTLLITDTTITLAARSGILPSLRYREFHTYACRTDASVKVTVEHRPGDTATALNPKTGTAFSPAERQEIGLLATDNNHALISCLYAPTGEAVMDPSGNPLAQVLAGDAVALIGTGTAVVREPGLYQLRPLSAYDALRGRLDALRERYASIADADAITIAAEDKVAYDKIIQLMDVARKAGFTNVAIARLRA